jgi:hypothetical protein
VAAIAVKVAVSLLGWHGFLNVVKENIATRTLGVKSTESRNAWHVITNTLADFDLQYLSPTRGIVSDFDIAEGHLYGLQLLTTAVELFADSDHLRPEFKVAESPTRKWWGDNPDCIYKHCLIHSDQAYIVSGSLGSVTYLSLTVYSTPNPGQFAAGTFSFLNSKSLVADSAGNFVIVLSNVRPPDCVNWVPLAGGFLSIIVRGYYEERIPAGTTFV